MTLREVGSTLERLGSATLTQLAAELGASPREVEMLLEFWTRRGNVTRCSAIASGACGTSCTRCPLGVARASGTGRDEAASRTTVYEWCSRPREAAARATEIVAD